MLLNKQINKNGYKYSISTYSEIKNAVATVFMEYILNITK